MNKFYNREKETCYFFHVLYSNVKFTIRITANLYQQHHSHSVRMMIPMHAHNSGGGVLSSSSKVPSTSVSKCFFGFKVGEFVLHVPSISGLSIEDDMTVELVVVEEGFAVTVVLVDGISVTMA